MKWSNGAVSTPCARCLIIYRALLPMKRSFMHKTTRCGSHPVWCRGRSYRTPGWWARVPPFHRCSSNTSVLETPWCRVCVALMRRWKLSTAEPSIHWAKHLTYLNVLKIYICEYTTQYFHGKNNHMQVFKMIMQTQKITRIICNKHLSSCHLYIYATQYDNENKGTLNTLWKLQPWTTIFLLNSQVINAAGYALECKC